MSLLLIIIVLLLLFGGLGGGYYGYRGGYMGQGGFGILGVVVLIIVVVLLFGGFGGGFRRLVSMITLLTGDVRDLFAAAAE